MSSAPENERDLLAAEHALGLLDGAEREEAERLAERDADFRQLADAWRERLGPWFEEIQPVAPDEAVWARINETLDGEGGRASNVHSLARRARLWRNYSAVVSAVAAALLLVIAVDPFGPPEQQPRTPQAEAQATLVANVIAEDRSAAFVVSYDPAGKTMLVSPALANPAPGHDHQLWLIPASGAPRSIGLVASSAPHRLAVAAELQPDFRRDATIAISVEPVGGSPTGQPTGPVVASGKLVTI